MELTYKNIFDGTIFNYENVDIESVNESLIDALVNGEGTIWKSLNISFKTSLIENSAMEGVRFIISSKSVENIKTWIYSCTNNVQLQFIRDIKNKFRSNLDDKGFILVSLLAEIDTYLIDNIRKNNNIPEPDYENVVINL